MQMDLNQKSQTLEQCLKTTNKLGSDIYRNICTGEVFAIPWGGTDWLICIVLTLIALVLITLLAGVAYKIWTDY